ncbi:MAG TPA: hypothetical protein V6C81_11890 [Planktothrix sp.]
MLAVIVISALIGIFGARSMGSMNVGTIGIGIVIVAICTAIGGLIGAFSGAILASAFVSLLVGSISFGGTRALMK